MSERIPFYFAWASLDKLTYTRYKKIKAYFGDFVTAWQNATQQSLVAAGFSQKIAAEIMQQKSLISPDAEYAKAQKLKVDLISIEDDRYPLLLKEISSPPVFLYYKGSINKDDVCFAVVGARQVSTYGKQVCAGIARDLCYQGLTIVSGLALGVDSLAHKEAVNTKMRTIAVLGNGLDMIYPIQNKVLAEQIIQNGAIISEFPFGTPPNNFNFPRRNRIISGMSVGTLVIEAKSKSGSLITARNAIEQNREVFAIPGSIYNPKSEGTNQLIQKGEAKLVTSVNDILEEINLNLVKSQNTVKTLVPSQALTSMENQVLKLLSNEPILFDALTSSFSDKAAALSSTLSLLEMKGFVKNMGNNQWIKLIENKMEA